MEVKNPIIELFYKSYDVQLMKNYSNNFYGPLKINDLRNELEMSPLHLACITGLAIVILTNISLDKEKIWNKILFVFKSRGVCEFFYVTTCLSLALIFLPLMLSIFITFKIHKLLIKNQLEKDKALHFKDFIEGEDVVWMLENKNTKSVINVLAFVNVEGDLDLLLPETLLQSIRERIYTKVMLQKQFPKLFYRTQRTSSGYFYWIDENPLTINDYVRYIENNRENVEISEQEFRDKMAEICNQSMPADDTALWECLISQQVLRSKDGGLKIPVVFRVHHAVGDGVALLRLFLEALADKDSINVVNNPILEEFKDTLSLKFYRFLINFLTILKSPSILCSQALKAIDINKIHPTQLSGKKKINWLYESSATKQQNYPTLLTLVKLLKRQFPGARFSNILLAALSKSLRDFFTSKNYEIPKDMTVVIPARLYNTKESLSSLKLENKFSVALQTLPIDVIQFDDRIDKVRKFSDMIVASPDYQINYFMMSVVAAIFPDWILKVILNSKHATMAVSNLPGPNFTIKINGLNFNSVGFFIPNIGQTAIGLTILSYDDKLHFGMMADEAAIDSDEDLSDIINGMTRELYEMAENLLK